MCLVPVHVWTAAWVFDKPYTFDGIVYIFMNNYRIALLYTMHAYCTEGTQARALLAHPDRKHDVHPNASHLQMAVPHM